LNFGPTKAPLMKLVNANFVCIAVHTVNDGAVDEVFDVSSVGAPGNDSQCFLFRGHPLPAGNQRLANRVLDPECSALMFDNVIALTRLVFELGLAVVFTFEHFFPPRII